MSLEPLAMLSGLLAPLAEAHASPLWVKALGWGGQTVFAGRVIVQWIASERARRPVAPELFWWLSALGAVMMSAYTVLRGEMVMLPNFVVTLCIYVRNLWLAHNPDAAQKSSLVHVIAIGLIVAVGPYAFGLLDSQGRVGPELPWLALAILGQVLWIGRFLVQWRHAERHGKSEFPAAFWWLTIVGSSALLAYALHRHDHVLIFGFLLSWFVPARNLMLHHRHAKTAP